MIGRVRSHQRIFSEMKELLKIQHLVRAAKALLIESENAQRFDAMQCDYILDPTIAILDAVLDEVNDVVQKEQSLQVLAPAEVWPATAHVPIETFKPSAQVPFSMVSEPPLHHPDAM